MPDKAKVFENPVNHSAIVVKSSLKVMLEEDFLALKSHKDNTAVMSSSEDIAHSIASRIVREIIVPLLTKEVNEGQNFAGLRQVYNSLILAVWYKNKLKKNLLSKGYVDRNKTVGVDIEDKNGKGGDIPAVTSNLLRRAFTTTIKEEPDPVTNEDDPA